MAALESLNFDKEDAIHYYHCILHNVPMNLNVSQLAPMIVPRVDSEIVKKLFSSGCRVVPHQLHMYKEPLDTKFGYATFFIHQTCTMAGRNDLHDLIIEWIQKDLSKQLETIQVKVSLGQPPECHSACPFLRALNQQCSFLDPSMVRDSKKLETFLLSKVTFSEEALNAHKNDSEEKKDTLSLHEKDVAAWKVVGKFKLSSLMPKEILWLKREHGGFPPIQVINGNVSQATCDPSELITFFENALFPLIDAEK